MIDAAAVFDDHFMELNRNFKKISSKTFFDDLQHVNDIVKVYH